MLANSHTLERAHMTGDGPPYQAAGVESPVEGMRGGL
jgi:acid stress-induced BolA-like protein IbaG/YrbA